MTGLSEDLGVHIQYLLKSLDGSNSDAVFKDLCEYVGCGAEGGIVVLQNCLDYLNINEEDLKNEPVDPVFSSIFKHILDKPNFSTIFCQSLKDKEINEVFLENLSMALGLSKLEKIGVGLAILDFGNVNPQVYGTGRKFFIKHLEELCTDDLSLGSAEQIQSIFRFLQQSDSLSKHFDLFVQKLSLKQLKGDEHFILDPLMLHGFPNGRNLDLFYEDHEADFDAFAAKMQKERNMADTMKELGYGCTVSVPQCKEVLSLFLPLTEVVVARILGTIICTTGLPDAQDTFSTFSCALGYTNSSDQPVLNSWNIDVLIDSIKQLAPSISWLAVIENLDYRGFYIPNEAAFSFFMSIYRCACQDPFPLHAICGSIWRNTLGQLSFLNYAVVAPHEVFTFAHCKRELAYEDIVPGHILHRGTTSNAWICLELMQTLCQLAEVGHADAVRSMLKLPLEQCPEVLLLGMSSINTTYNLIQHEVSSTVLPTILNNGTVIDIVLYMWHIKPNILLRGFIDSHRINPENISRIFYICQELKILIHVLDMVPSFFGIRLAALASHEDLVDMEKWLRSNLATYQDSFYEECTRFVKDQLGSSQDASAEQPRLSVSLCNIYSGITSTIDKVLQEYRGLIVTDPLTEEMEQQMTLSTHVNSLMNNSAPSELTTVDGPVDDIEAEANSSTTAVLPSSVGFRRPSRATSLTKFGFSLNIETLIVAAEKRGTHLKAPEPEIQDKISFIINNLSAANIESKAKEFTEILIDQYHPWFAQYMVMKRVSIEPNFHDLYLKFFNKVGSRCLDREILQATYENCKVLLGSELIKSSSEERSLLTNLGSWLGKITVGCNRYISAREIDPKSLIIEAYEKGLMIAVIPFTSKILESCKNSVAYQPPNRWPMSILELLAEIYFMPNLKMDLKFDIEVLFKNLGQDMEKVIPTSLLKEIVRQTEGNPDFSTQNVAASSEIKPIIASASNHLELPLEIPKSAPPGGPLHTQPQFAVPAPQLTSSALREDSANMTALNLSDVQSSAQGLSLRQQSIVSVNQLSASASIEEQVVVNPNLHALGLYLHFKSVIPSAMERAVKEIVSVIEHRCVSIAMKTTEELVLKDYAMEGDETQKRNAAHLMVSRLAGSLAHVTCKDHFCHSFPHELRNALEGINIETELLEQAIQIVTNDNMNLGWSLIEQAITAKAIEILDEEITHQLATTRKHIEGVGPPSYDSGLYPQQGPPGLLQEFLCLQPDYLSNYQQQVYNLTLQNQLIDNNNTIPDGSIPLSSSSVTGQFNTNIYSSDMANSWLGPLTRPLDLTSKEMESSTAHLHSTDRGVNQSNFNAELAADGTSNIVKESGSFLQPLYSTTASDLEGNSSWDPLFTSGDALENCLLISNKLEEMVHNKAKEDEIQGLIGEVPGVILKCICREEAALTVAQMDFNDLYERSSNSAHVSVYLSILASIRDVCRPVVDELTNWVINSEEGRKLNKNITVGLMRYELLNLAEYNIHMAKLLDAGNNSMHLVEFGLRFGSPIWCSQCWVQI